MKYKILINNFNRLDPLKKLLHSIDLIECVKEIHIVDNRSNWEPLLEFYKKCDAKIHFLEKNCGHLAPSKIFSILDKNEPFVSTDSDVFSDDKCPKNILLVLHEILDEYRVGKSGPSLRIDNLPPYPMSDQVKNWESKYWIKETKCKKGYIADIDTTFCLYRNKSYFGQFNAIRLKPPYQFIHADWYENPYSLSNEYRNYLKTCNDSASWGKHMKKIIEELKNEPILLF